MHMTDLIEKKKQGQTLTQEELHFIVHGYTAGDIPDYQMSALMMAIYFRGMTPEETAQLTIEMEHSGDVVDLSPLGEHTADKHSTGGVGDKTSLVLCPMVAACGGKMAKMSGRGLGHTGGTIDKLESFPGFSTAMTPEKFLENAENVGFVIAGQTANLAPADKKMYALRDVTATVDSIPLIVSSIMAKKLASGARTIVLDVKTGAGALMHTTEASIELAQTMVRIGCDAGRRMVALVTDMGEPLGSHIGNALEVKEAIDVLNNRVEGPLLTVAVELGARMLLLGGAASSVAEGRDKLMAALHSGAGLEKLRQMIVAQGGDPACCDDVSQLPQAKIIRDVPAVEGGYIRSMDTIRLGNTAQAMGAGRKQKTDPIDYSVGFVMHKRIGDELRPGEAVATVHASSEESAARAASEILACLTLSPTPVPRCKLIHAFVDSDHVERL